MSVNYRAQKCPTCDGNMEYIKEDKIWQCPYCGNKVERIEQYDGLFTIKNVVCQALKDIAYRRFENAQRNIFECEKIDSKYVGTVLCKLAFDVIRLITPGACSDREKSNIAAQIGSNYDALTRSDLEEERALYDFIEDNDAYAMLVCVFDIKCDDSRRDMLLGMVEATHIYAKETKSALLSFAERNNRIELVNALLQNIESLDIRSAFFDLLKLYPDLPEKSGHAQRLLTTGEFTQDDHRTIENYVQSSADSIETKLGVTQAALQLGISVSLAISMEYLMVAASSEQTKTLVRFYCNCHLDDEATRKFVEFAFVCGDEEKTLSILLGLSENDHFVIIGQKDILSLLSNDKVTTQSKIRLLKTCASFRIDGRGWGGICSSYLLYNQSNSDERIDILTVLLEYSQAISPDAVEAYLLKNSFDGRKKTDILKMLLNQKNILSRLNELLSKYIFLNIDLQDTKNDIIHLLLSKGFKVSPSALCEFVCDQGIDTPVKISWTQLFVRNGSQLKSDVASRYIETISPSLFSSELFSFIVIPGSAFSSSAVIKYLLQIQDRQENKAENFNLIIQNCSNSVTSEECHICHLGHSITCNLLQAYILTSNDVLSVANQIVDLLISTYRLKINAEMFSDGTKIRLKKYYMTNKGEFSETTIAICDKLKLTSMLF